MTPRASRVSTQVGIVGAGPAGLVAAHVLLGAGIDVRVVEHHAREQVEQQPRAGLLEHRVVEYLRHHRLADRLLAEGSRHGWCDFLCLGERVRVDYAGLNGGFGHWVYPQQFLIRDLVAGLERLDRTPYFSRPARAVTGTAERRPRIECDGLRVECDAVLACDGSRGGIGGALTAADGRRPAAYRYPYDWLTALAEVDRPVPGVVYALHADGFAGMMPRAGHQARLYFQVPAGDSPGQWDERRMRDVLAARTTGADPRLPRVRRISGAGVLRMRAGLSRTVRHGRMLVAGDAAHVLTPSGAKGMNLAVADAADAAVSLIRWLRDGDSAGVDGYQARRLSDAWRTQEFSDRLLDLLHLPAGQDPAISAGHGRDAEFPLRVRRERLARLARPGALGAAFAHWYAGSGREADDRVPLPPRPRPFSFPCSSPRPAPGPSSASPPTARNTRS